VFLRLRIDEPGAVFTGAGLDSALAAELELVEVDDTAGEFWVVSTLVKRRPG
jgi:hypothetical protein